jgi:LmbE family N-acetylglucosaminyl deacetylase
MKTLIIAAHPDDEVLGCGGTIAKIVKGGGEIHVLILATGLTSRRDFELSRQDQSLELHYSRARKAAALLGVSNVTFAGFPDQKMDTVPLLDVAQRIEAEIETVRPAVVFTHHGGDLNYDHVLAYRATLTATRPFRCECVRSVYAYEIPSSTEWAFQRFSPAFRPSVFYNIEGFLQAKLDAMAVYETEIGEFPHPRSLENISIIARRWGSVVGLSAAEAFEPIRQIID